MNWLKPQHFQKAFMEKLFQWSLILNRPELMSVSTTPCRAVLHLCLKKTFFFFFLQEVPGQCERWEISSLCQAQGKVWAAKCWGAKAHLCPSQAASSSRPQSCLVKQGVQWGRAGGCSGNDGEPEQHIMGEEIIEMNIKSWYMEVSVQAEGKVL